MAESRIEWNAAQIRRAIDRYVRENRELVEGVPVEKIVMSAIAQAYPDEDPADVFASSEIQRQAERLRREFASAGLVKDPQPTIPGLEVPGVVERTDESGNPVAIDGRSATVEEVAQHWERLAIDAATEAALARKTAVAGRHVTEKLRALGVDVTTVAYRDVPDEAINQLRASL